jgi:hypothetical protein
VTVADIRKPVSYAKNNIMLRRLDFNKTVGVVQYRYLFCGIIFYGLSSTLERANTANGKLQDIISLSKYFLKFPMNEIRHSSCLSIGVTQSACCVFKFRLLWTYTVITYIVKTQMRRRSRVVYIQRNEVYR